MQGLFQFLQQWQGSFECIIVDDGSTDSSDLAIKNHPHFPLLSSHIQILTQANQGKGAALKTGIQQAQGDFILTLDADMATEPTELIQWLKMRQTFYTKEILIGSRELKNSDVQDLGYRKIVGNIFNAIIRLFTGLPFRDTQCGFKLYPAAAAKALFDKLQTPGWSHDVEILKRANRLGYAIVEMPVHWKAIEGSKIRVVQDGFKMLFEVIRISFLKD